MTLLVIATASLCAAAPALGRPGDLDPSYGTAGVQPLSFTNPLGNDRYGSAGLAPIGFEPNGDAVVAGGASFSYACTSYGCTSNSSGLVAARLKPDGSLDPDFGDDGTTSIELSKAEQNFGPDDIALDAQGRIILAVTDYPGGLRVYRLTRDGKLDPSFSSDGELDLFPPGEAGAYTKIAGQSDGGIILVSRDGGDFYRQAIRLIRIAPGGSVDSSFPSGGQPTELTLKGFSYLDSMAIDSQDRIVAHQQFSAADNTLPAEFYRFKADGSVDTSFGDDGELEIQATQQGDYAARGLAIDDSNHIFTIGRKGIFKLNPDGTKDTSFGAAGLAAVPGSPLPNAITFAPDQDGGVYVSSLGFDGWTTLRLTHLLASGSPDPNFGMQGVASSFAGEKFGGVPAVAIDPSGRPFVASGVYALDGATARFRIDDDPPDDRDADGFADADDECPARSGSQAGCPVYERTLTLRRGKTWRPRHVLLKAVVGSARDECIRDQRLKLYRRRPGRDRRIANVKLKVEGTPAGAIAHSFPVKRSWKRYYARVKGTFDARLGRCPELRSRVVRAKRGRSHRRHPHGNQTGKAR